MEQNEDSYKVMTSPEGAPVFTATVQKVTSSEGAPIFTAKIITSFKVHCNGKDEVVPSRLHSEGALVFTAMVTLSEGAPVFAMVEKITSCLHCKRLPHLKVVLSTTMEKTTSSEGGAVHYNGKDYPI
jgi:hypothetical protein